jgi:NAD(P)H-dependent FMN reductase
MLRIAVLVGSTRPHRKAGQVARWVHEVATRRPDARFEVLDLADHPLPLLDEPFPPMMGRYQHDHTRAWAETVARFDGFVVVTPEYNHSVPAALKNAFDHLYAEWNHKAVGFVSYGTHCGIRAVEHLRLVAAELKMADVRTSVSLSVFTDFENHTTFVPAPRHERVLDAVLDEVVAWSGALAPLRRTDEAA